MIDPILAALTSDAPIKKQKKKKLPEPPQDVYEEAYSLQEKKLQEEVRKLKIGNDIAMRNLVEKKLVQAILAEVGHTLQTVIVDRGRREAPIMAAKLGIPEKERDLEVMLNDQDERAMNALVNTIERLCDEGVFE